MKLLQRIIDVLTPNPYDKNGNFSQEKYDKINQNIIEKFNKKYDLSTIQGIESIPVPQQKSSKEPFSAVCTDEAILKKKATEYKRMGNMDLAIACLRKANQLMPYSWYSYSLKDYMRLVEYLKKERRFDEARIEEGKIQSMFTKSTTPIENINKKNLEDSVFKSDIVEIQYSPFVCAECAKYTNRWFSISGEDTRFPKLPEYFMQHLPEHKYCCTAIFPVLDGISSPTFNYTGNFIQYCNRPFIDERTEEQKNIFKTKVTEREDELIDKDFYDMLWEKFPNICPKSYGGYRRMKNAQTENYKKIIMEVNQQLGYDYYQREHAKRFIDFDF